MADDFYSDPMNMFRAIGAGTGPGSLPMPKMVSPAEVRREAGSHSKSILASWSLLKGIIDRHEATIQKRWTKKTKTQRLRILLDAWPNMASSHRPDFEAFRKETEHQRDIGTKYRDAYMWPHINQEDLSKPRTLLLLLNARGRHHPAEFAASDGEAIHLGLVSKAIVPDFLNEYTMLLNGMTSANEYGKLVNWDDDEDAFRWLNERIQYQPGEGLLILDAQDRLMSFLVACSKQVLHDISPDALLADEYPIQLEPLSRSETGSGGFDSLAVMAAEGPYRPPAQIDFERIISLLSARESAAEDHLWLLREDPGYFADRVLNFKEHRQELLEDTLGQPHPLIRLQRQDTFFSRVIGGIVSEAYLGLEMFAELRAQAQHLQILKTKYSRDISPKEELPQEYMRALLKFQHYLNQSTKGPLNQLKHSLIASPPWRPYFVREPPPNSITPHIRAMEKQSRKMDSIQRDLLHMLRILWEDGQELFLFRKTNMVDELERLIKTDKKAEEMISDFIAAQISDLTIICECLRQLDLYQPWANNFDEKMVDEKESLMEDFEQRNKPLGDVLKALDPSTGYARLGDPTDSKFYYPVDKRRNKDNVEAMKQAESKLDAFWTVIDQSMQRHVGDLRDTAVGRLLGQSRVLLRTPPWAEPVKRQGKEPASTEDPRASIKPLSELYFNPEQRSSKKIESTETTRPKEKIKTRGTPAPQELVMPAPTLAANPEDVQPTFPVDARALKVFRTLFYTPSLTATPGELPWTDFLHAMTSTGFRAEKLYGSAWQFTPTRLDVERGIQFHEPHPVGKIAFRVARRFGRRLARAYGWLGEMFVLKEKDNWKEKEKEDS